MLARKASFIELRFMIPALGARNEYEHARRMFLLWRVLLLTELVKWRHPPRQEDCVG